MRNNQCRRMASMCSPLDRIQYEHQNLASRRRPMMGRPETWASHCFNLEKRRSDETYEMRQQNGRAVGVWLLFRHRNSGILAATEWASKNAKRFRASVLPVWRWYHLR